MRKLIVKYLALDYRFEYNAFRALSEIFYYISIAAFIYNLFVGIILFLLASILLAIGLIKNNISSSRSRASYILFPLASLTGYFILLGLKGFVNNNLFLVPLLFFILIALLSFVYLKYFPIKWEELDDSQKIQYAESEFVKLTAKQYEEYSILKNKYNNKKIK